MRLLLALALLSPARSAAAACPPAVAAPEAWPSASVRMEDEVLDVINRHRAFGLECRATGTRHPPAPPLATDSRLRQAARRHSLYMAEHGAFDHTLRGCFFSSWIDAAGYRWTSLGENLALRRGTRTNTAEAVVGQWIASREGHCEALMDPRWRAAGVGYAGAGNRHLWTVDFGDR